jgi:hypothetical protein
VDAANTSLSEVLCYQNDDVVQRCAEDFGLSLDEAQANFTEMKKWLWLCGEQSRERCVTETDSPGLTLFDSMSGIDQMWHTFILFTHDYAAFCEKNFGAFIHHVPQTKSETPLTTEARMERIQFTLEFIYDRLGPDTLSQWCDTQSEVGHEV